MSRSRHRMPWTADPDKMFFLGVAVGVIAASTLILLVVLAK